MSKQCLVQNFEITSTFGIGFYKQRVILTRLQETSPKNILHKLNLHHKYFNPTPSDPDNK